MKEVTNIGRCIGSIEAVEYFESLPPAPGKEETHEYALNRIRFEAAKEVGVKPKLEKAIYKWHKDRRKCGHCGFGITEPMYHYCPNCGTAILDNPYTEKRLNREQIIAMWTAGLEDEAEPEEGETLL